MRDVWKILERQQLQAEIDEVEQTLKSIKCQRDILMEKGAKETIARIGDIYKELLRGGLSPEQKEKLMREKDELWEDPLYIEFRSYAEPSRKAFDKLFKAKRRLEELLAEEAAPTAPPAAIAPLPSGNAESKFSSSLLL